MTCRKLVMAALFLTLASCHSAPHRDPAKPGDYALQLPLQPAPEGSLQRLELPAAAVIAFRRADLGDVRVFDAKDKVVPLALLTDAAVEGEHPVNVPVYPVMGPAGAFERSDLSIRIEDGRVAKVVTVDSSPAAASAPVAALLDTHALSEPAIAIELAADLPAGQPITLRLATSGNLKDWQPLTEKVFFRPAAGAALLGGGRIALAGVDLHGRYVGVGWDRASNVVLRSANVVVSAVAPSRRIVVATHPVPLKDAHDLRLDLSAIARPVAMQLTETGADGVIPVKLSGRKNPEAPWTPLAVETLRPGPGGAILELPRPSMTHYRLEADERTAGFSSPPRVALLFDPVELLVALSGTPPYRLAVGQADAPAAYLSLADVLPRGETIDIRDLPKVRLVARDGPPPLVTLNAGAADGAIEPRKVLLWAVLLLGTLILALAARGLLRANGPDKDAEIP